MRHGPGRPRTIPLGPACAGWKEVPPSRGWGSKGGGWFHWLPGWMLAPENKLKSWVGILSQNFEVRVQKIKMQKTTFSKKLGAFVAKIFFRYWSGGWKKGVVAG